VSLDLDKTKSDLTDRLNLVPLQDLSPAVQDYLKAIAKAELAGERASTNLIAAALGFSAPSVTAMLKKLAERGLVERTPYRGVVLTETGRRLALEALRHHRLLERYLVETLGLSIPEAHAEADRLEHALSEDVEARIDAALGYPESDPHGDPIPDANLRLRTPQWQPLSGIEEGESRTIRRVPDTDEEMLRYLADLDLMPGAPVELVLAAPFNGPLTVRSRGGEHAISRELAATIGVE
jgi:DtxR family transcriptional regulator, Mn-dependent transcriptional regulator